MKTATVKKRNIARELTKGYIRLLTQAVATGAKAVDNYFFDEESDDDSEIRPYFYGSLAFGLVVSLIILITVV